MRKKGHLIILSGPSGVGKDAVVRELLRIMPELRLSVSATTRARRPREVEGKSYYFCSMEQFNQLIDQGRLIEYAKVHDHFYGTPREKVEKELAEGHDIILVIDVQGASQVRNNYDDGVFIFILPPQLSDLTARLKKRGTEDPASMELRLKDAEKEIAMLHEYDYAVINDQVSRCAEKIAHIIKAEGQRIDEELVNKYWRQFHD